MGERTTGQDPVRPDAGVSVRMARMPREDTAPEVAVRRLLHARGIRFRVNVSGLPGRPDIVLSRARVAVFIDGCFWHSCPEHGTLPKSNREWWRAKLQGNVERDRRKDRDLWKLGWATMHFWEHEDPESVAVAIEHEWRLRTGRA